MPVTHFVKFHCKDFLARILFTTQKCSVKIGQFVCCAQLCADLHEGVVPYCRLTRTLLVDVKRNNPTT